MGIVGTPFLNTRDNNGFHVMPAGGRGVAVGDKSLADRVQAAVRSRVSSKSLMSELIRATYPILGSSCMIGECLCFAHYTDNGPEEVFHLIVLPDFDLPARSLRFDLSQERETLVLWEVWFAQDPRLGPIDPVAFGRKYKILVEDREGFRSALFEILRERGAPVGLFWQDPEGT